MQGRNWQSFQEVGLALTYATPTVLYWLKQSQASPDLRGGKITPSHNERRVKGICGQF